MRWEDKWQKLLSGKFLSRVSIFPRLYVFLSSNLRVSASPFLFFSLCLLVCFLTACSELEKPKTEPFIAQTAPPVKREFRWSNGKMPKSFDPAMAAAAPETDVVRAVYEGLTDTDPVTLQAVPAIALEWISANDDTTWTFKLRRDAEWTNGERVTARDFVRSWKRLADMGDKVAAKSLLQNIVGMPAPEKTETAISIIPKPDTDFPLNQPGVQKLPLVSNKTEANTAGESKKDASPAADANTAIIERKESAPKTEEKTPAKPEIKFGVTAINDYTLQVSLIKSDKDFPRLVAHPLFRPVYGDGKYFETDKLNAQIVTNGAFRIRSVAADGITLDRDDDFFDSDAVELERVKFVPSENAEKALENYKAGEVDVVTNADFEPLALKLLTPFEDFKQKTYGALNFYEFNRQNKPFDDNRVRQALAISIDRDRLTEGEMEGATIAALGFSPFDDKGAKLVQNVEKAQDLLADAGFENGANFPVIRLIVNRNDAQQRVARSVAKMWKQNLNVETKIIVKDAGDLETSRQTGDYDLMRRGVVLPTGDETANMLSMFEPRKIIVKAATAGDDKETVSTVETKENDESGNKKTSANVNTQILKSEKGGKIEKTKNENQPVETFETKTGELILSEHDAIDDLPAIPLYFPTAYSLVKPYVEGFEINSLDAPSLKNVRIDDNWQPKKPGGAE